MPNLVENIGHFMASIEIMPHGPEPDRRSRPAWNFMRWNFVYEEYEEEGVWDVWPHFLDEKGMPIPDGVPCTGTMSARMHIVFPESIPKHFARLKIGTKFYCKDGPIIAAIGTVTKLSV